MLSINVVCCMREQGTVWSCEQLRPAGVCTAGFAQAYPCHTCGQELRVPSAQESAAQLVSLHLCAWWQIVCSNRGRGHRPDNVTLATRSAGSRACPASTVNCALLSGKAAKWASVTHTAVVIWACVVCLVARQLHTACAARSDQ